MILVKVALVFAFAFSLSYLIHYDSKNKLADGLTPDEKIKNNQRIRQTFMCLLLSLIALLIATMY